MGRAWILELAKEGTEREKEERQRLIECLLCAEGFKPAICPHQQMAEGLVPSTFWKLWPSVVAVTSLTPHLNRCES